MKYRQYLYISMILAMTAPLSLAGASLTSPVCAAQAGSQHRYASRADGASSISSGLMKDTDEKETTAGTESATEAETETESATEAEMVAGVSGETEKAAETESKNRQKAARTDENRAGKETAKVPLSDEKIEAILKQLSPLEGLTEDSGSSISEGPVMPGLFPDDETEAETETETETETDSESERETEAETETEEVPIASDSSQIIGEEQKKPELVDPSQSAHSLFDRPSVSGYNPARVNLYDYRMLRSYPLSSLPRDLHTLYTKLGDLTETYDGTWSVYVEDLSTRQALIVGDQPMKSASTMKLFIMAAVYDQIEEGQIERTDEVVSLLHDMISHSSNEAANRLLLLLGHDDYAAGIQKVDSYISEHGYSEDTHEYNGFEDSDAVVDGSHFNQISAKDIGLLLERVYSRNFISRKVCNEIEDMMLNQSTRYKIPKALPEGVEVANKTGEMDTVENDAAVVYGEKTDFILVVLSEDWDSKDTAMEEIHEITSTVYDYLN